ncbi:hypothetical protein NC652_018309 [Populus alba x Populus x berolinensis]|uniref:Uncharacterized protein n=1 Tax=Populus alba x Populus x berolinensis TaxID=444605 RepID=A0AAD6QGB2_9ROSI|nr:hypothetical protein NC652_018257 [Populus alba x Populus x berolinensis]KAJ6915576.1 hypothetical protein NC652_018270 [Populus alba x Populus x berolinensis]KAJ6915618.1 hypothetical protein NC652_018309 [Populus alba x Populus x berolinensis]KAJ6989799.1 hypothetical protein NC653_018335 [Populus alba x Populus x berolinensis]
MGSAWDTPLGDPEGLRSDANNQSKTPEGSFLRVPSTWLSKAPQHGQFIERIVHSKE